MEGPAPPGPFFALCFVVRSMARSGLSVNPDCAGSRMKEGAETRMREGLETRMRGGGRACERRIPVSIPQHDE